jgi:hypothetical protein
MVELPWLVEAITRKVLVVAAVWAPHHLKHNKKKP